MAPSLGNEEGRLGEIGGEVGLRGGCCPADSLMVSLSRKGSLGVSIWAGIWVVWKKGQRLS